MDYGLYWLHGPPWVVLLGVKDALSDQTVMLSNNVLEHHPQAMVQVEGRATRYYDLRICAFVGSLNQPAVLRTLNASNASLQDLTSPVSSYSPDCSILYGRYLNRASCQNALAKIPQVTTPMTFGQRGTGDWDVILPSRYLSDDGQCAFDVEVDPNGAKRDVSNYLEITNAASALFHTCVEMRLPSTGGTVKQLGTF
ncbi:hypothetical protein IMSHALPRED_008939 [Imshaugia aleurites]|uniref:Uncharacterized protein n=1 Tax=Imshaugia aleurites TaxID=172621 RepID=A0A8H3ILN7_9LECA|nr:hypothetical protein IMSHALPRED_008939 [Imshaugia aleurites]